MIYEILKVYKFAAFCEVPRNLTEFQMYFTLQFLQSGPNTQTEMQV